MTKIHALSAAAVLLFAFAACQKEKESNIPSPVEPVTGHASFTASIASPGEGAVKTTIADNGRQTWCAGDQILVSNGAKTISVANDGTMSCTGCTYDADAKQLVDDSNSQLVAEWLTITDGMISDEGKTLDFTANVYEPASYYCFFVTGPNPHVYSLTTGGRVVTRAFAEVNASRESQDGHLLARCPKDETHVSFKNTLAYLAFESAADYYAATFIPNSGNGQIAYKINADLSNLEYADNGSTVMKNAGVSAILDGNHDRWYLPLAPDYTFTGGFTFILWSDAADYAAARSLTLDQIKEKDNWAGTPVFFTSTADFTVQMGHVVNMGDVSAHVKFNSNYALWAAGHSIRIDGVDYDKNTAPFDGVDATLISTNQNITSAGVYFVKSGVKVTLSENVEGNVLIVGDAVESGVVGKRGAELATSSGKCFQNGTVILKGLSVTHNGDPMFNGASTVVIDDCFVKTVSWKYLATIPDGAEVEKFALVNSDLIVRQGIINKLDSGSRTINTFKISNSVLSRSEAVGTAAICQGSSTTDVGSVILSGNTFINFAHATSSYDALALKSLESFTSANNYFYLAAEGKQVNLTSAAVNTHSISGTRSTGYTSGVKYHMGDKWPSDNEEVDSQFVDLDLTADKPDFSLNTTEYGAQR